MGERNCGFGDTRKEQSGRAPTKDLSPEEKIAYLEHQLKFKDQQIEALKNKFCRQEGSMEKANEKFKIIEDLLSRDDNLLNISWLCEIAQVSRTGYYNK